MLKAHDYISENDLALQLLQEVDPNIHRLWQRVADSTDFCESCDGKGERDIVSPSMGGVGGMVQTTTICKRCEGRGDTVVILINGEQHAATMIEAYDLIGSGHATLAPSS